MSDDREARDERDMRRERDQGLRVGQHLAPARRRRLRAEADIGERRFGEDAERELDGACTISVLRMLGRMCSSEMRDRALARDARREDELALPER